MKEVLYGPPAQAPSPTPTLLTATLPRPFTRPDDPLPPATVVAGRLAVQLWLISRRRAVLQHQRPRAKGTGLGLPVSLGIVAAAWRARSGREPAATAEGARFMVRIPAGSDATAADPGRLVPSPGPHPGNRDGEARPRVLVVDDERSVRLALGRYLQRYGWEVDRGGGRRGGAGHAGRHSGGRATDLVITDLRMPRLLGPRRARLAGRAPSGSVRAADHRPPATWSRPAVRDFLDRTPRPVLEKPFELSMLAELVGW